MTARLLEGKSAIVTGASSGLGLGIARRFIAEGARAVYSFDSHPPSSDGPPELRWRQVDVSDPRSVEDEVAEAWSSAGSIDILVCNAAVMQSFGYAVDLEDGEVSRVMAVNFGGVVNCCRAVGRRMRERGYGRIVTVGSQVSVAPWPGMAAYAASKAAVVSFSRALALETASQGVVVNCIMPGTMDTAQMRTTFTSRSTQTGVPLDELIDAKARSMPLGRLGSPEDAASMTTWLASDDASFSVGAVFDLTGGELWSRVG